MNYTILFSFVIIISSCTTLLKGGSNDYDLLVKNATEFLLRRKIITDRCVTQKDTIYISLKAENKIVAKYYFYDNSLNHSSSNRCDSSRPRNQCLGFGIDSIASNNKLYFDFTCGSSAIGYLKISKKYEIEDIKYIERVE